MSDSETPVCPGCNSSDKVEPLGAHAFELVPKALPDAADLTRWFCARCNGALSALPALPAKSIGERFPFTAAENPPPADAQGAKRGRKRKEASGQ